MSRADRNKLSLVASIIPGLGHMMKGHVILGGVLLLGTVVMLFVAVWLSFATIGTSLVFLPLLWFGSVGASAYFIEDLTGHTPQPVSAGSEKSQKSDKDETLSDDERIDEAMKESFPASDPPSWNMGVERHYTNDKETDDSK